MPLPTRRAVIGTVLAAFAEGCRRTPSTARSAADLLNDAKADAQRSRRAIFALFHSSW